MSEENTELGMVKSLETPSSDDEHVSGFFGWKKDRLDFRDHQFGISVSPLALPQLVDLRKTMPLVYNQGATNSCHDDQTEVLTVDGWKFFSDVTLEDRLASVDVESKKLIFEHPVRLICLPFDGDLYFSSHRDIDFAVTPDHKMVVREWDEARIVLSGVYSFVDAKNIGWYCGLLTSVEYCGDGEQSNVFNIEGAIHDGYGHRDWSGGQDLQVSMHDWLQFLGFYIADGTMIKKSSCDHYKIQLAAGTQRKKDFIRPILQQLGITALELEDRFTFSHKRIYLAMEKMGLGGIHAPYKFVPEMVFKCNRDQIVSFLLGHSEGDGTRKQNICITHFTSSVRLAEDLQRLLFLSGKKSSIYIANPEGKESITTDGRVIRANFNCYAVSVHRSELLSIDRKENIQLKHYNGDVYCAEVPSYHTLVTRRNGKILISGNCTAQAIAACCEYEWITHGRGPDFIPSRLYIYWNTRWLDNDVNNDNGASLRDGMKAINKWGFCKEPYWPFNVRQVRVRPPNSAYSDGTTRRVYYYGTVNQNRNALMGTLASNQPIIFGIAVYDSFNTNATTKTGIVSMPRANESLLGGHAIVLTGYSMERRCYIFRNSWGSRWGDGGYGYLPFEYVENRNLASDFWAIRSI